jgi:hypothetical protein
VSVRGRARAVRERMNADEHYAVIEIDIEEVKNDTVRSVVIEGAVTISTRDEYRPWFEAALGEMEEM